MFGCLGKAHLFQFYNPCNYYFIQNNVYLLVATGTYFYAQNYNSDCYKQNAAHNITACSEEAKVYFFVYSETKVP
jgi:hypothetical protein